MKLISLEDIITHYRFTFQGQESDDEIKGSGNSVNYKYRMHDPRVGRFLSVDEKHKEHPAESTYSSFRNSPILYVDCDGNEWVNSHTARVKELEKQALDNPNDKQIQKNLQREREKEAKVAQYLTNLQENDLSLYNYVDQLQVEDRNGEKFNVKVNVSVDNYDANLSETAQTSYSNTGKHVKYENLEGKTVGFRAPMNENGEVGFDVKLNGEFSYHDVSLANEAGDVMYRMEYPVDSFQNGSDMGKSDTEYRSKGKAGDYSLDVEMKYKERKKSGEGKDPSNNPYPIKK